MIKKLITIALVAALLCVAGCSGCASCNGCNKTALFDGIYKFDRAVIQLPNGEVIEGKVDQWNDYDGDQLQIRIDGVWYLVHSSDAVLIAYSYETP